ncbi:hypothetical protein [Microbispora sp. NPDC049633]|uniref:hypothetical protein n=1 Tax=Microbispora sp. NPDC049633 TaxID=3154355 RepID=UPI003448FD8A
MNTSYDVKFWDIRRNASSKTPSYVVRWKVGGREKSKTLRTKALAESFLSNLRQAAKNGEAFDMVTGLPVSMLKVKNAVTWYSFALAYVDMKWPHAAAKTRGSLTDALARVTPALVVEDAPDAPDLLVLREALRQYALPRRLATSLNRTTSVRLSPGSRAIPSPLLTWPKSAMHASASTR